MNKAEIIAEIEANIGEVLLVKNINKADDPPEIGNWYQVTVKEVIGNVAQRPTPYIYVFDEGSPQEAAYYMDKLPSQYLKINNTTSSFLDIATAQVADKEQAGIIEKGIIAQVDEEKRHAVIRVYMIVNADIVNREYFLYEDKDLVIKFRRIIQE